MKVIVDANIVFSAILNTKGKIADILINSTGLIRFTAPDFLRIEIRKHHDRLAKISGMDVEHILESEFLVCRDIIFISEEQVSAPHWQTAFELVKNIDEKDAPYVAFSNHFNQKIWSGDKQLIKGLAKKKFENFTTTDQLYAFREELKKRNAKRLKK